MNKWITGRLMGLICAVAAAAMLALTGIGGMSIVAHADDSYVWTYQDGVMTVSVNSWDWLYGNEGVDVGADRWSDMHAYAGSVTELVIGDGVDELYRYAFQEFEVLTKVTLPSTIERVQFGVLQDCPALDTIVYRGTPEQWEDIQFGNGHIVVGDKLFSWGEVLTPMVEFDPQTSGKCGKDATWSYNDGVLTITGTGKVTRLTDMYADDVEEIVIGEGITGIANYVFRDYENLTKVSLPVSLNELYYAFEGCDAITTVDYAGTDYQWTQIVGIQKCTELLRAKPLNYGFEYTIDGDTLTITSISQPVDYEEGWKSPFTSRIKHIVIADGITSIGNNMFRDQSVINADLESITLGADVERIGDNAFARNGLPDNSCTLTMGSKVTDIGDQAFYKCNIQEITLPASLQSVGDYAFSDEIPDSWSDIGNSHRLLDKADYEGTDAQWDAIQLGEGNEELQMLVRGLIRGKCGDDLYYTLDEDGLLIISGTGDMTSTPWDNLVIKPDTVIIESGCTSICEHAFTYVLASADYGTMPIDVYVPLTVKGFGYGAFYGKYNTGCWVYYEGTRSQWSEVSLLPDEFGHTLGYDYVRYEYEVIDKQIVKKQTSGSETTGGNTGSDSTGGGTGESGTIEPGKTDGSNTGSDLDTGKSDTDIDDTTGRVDDQDTPDADDKSKNDGTGKDSKVDDTDSNDAEETPHKDRDDDEDRHGTKYLGWVTTKAGTATTDGVMEYRCSECGKVKYRVPISAYYNFNKESESSIKNAAQGATVKVDTKLFVSFHKSIVDELKARPDVTLVVYYTYLGVDYEMTIPAGSGALMEQLFGQDQFAGFRYLAGAFATVER